MLLVDARYQPAFAALELNSFDSVLRHFGGDKLPANTAVRVRTRELAVPGQPTVAVYYKQYEYRPASWAFLGRRSKARREFENYAAMEDLALACAQRIACGESRDAIGRLRRAFIITRAIPDAVSLLDFLTRPSQAPVGQPARTAIRQQLAQLTRASHAGGFFHSDLYWRNVLISGGPAGPPKVWWIDSPRGLRDTWSPWRDRRRIKDLAALDKAASCHCRRGERAAFVAEYLGKSRLDAEARQFIREVLAYRQHRWPEDWNER